jgi:Outer membrane protein beta-barrel domain
MKKLLFVLIMFSASLSYAQTQVAIGIKGGLNFANFQSDGDAEYEGRTGFHGGVFALVKVAKFGIQPEQQGSKLTINQTDFESNFNYINIPIMIKYYVLTHTHGGGISVQAGPQLGILQSAKADVFDSVQFVLNKDQDVKRFYKKSDLSLCLGAGWDAPFGLTVDFRYNIGLRKIEDEESDEAVRNSVFQFSLGFKLLKFGF